MERGEGGGFTWGGVEGWGEKAYNCNCITIKKKILYHRIFFIFLLKTMALTLFNKDKINKFFTTIQYFKGFVMFYVVV